jgi:prepilin-type N-terminal cleavage/methylation domain-containing protein
MMRSPFSSFPGWTLLEVMVALALMTVLSVMGYKGISILLTTQSVLSEEAHLLSTLGATFSQVDADWSQQNASLLNVSDQVKKNQSSENTPISRASMVSPASWEWTPLPGWIPSPSMLPKAPPPIEPLLRQTYRVEYRVHPNGGIDRLIECGVQASSSFNAAQTVEKANKNKANVPCQRWHMLNQLTSSIEAEGSQSTAETPHWMRWKVNTSKGIVERLWSIPAVKPAI